MARTADSKPTTIGTGVPALVPHGRFKGQPPMPLGRPVTVIGARNRAHLHLVSPSVSKSHAVVINSGSGYYIRDLASRSHIYVNGKKVHEADLKDGDIIAVGPFTFRFTDGGVPSRPADPVPAGVLRAKGRNLPMPLNGRTTLFGRRPTCDVPLEDLDVSTTHAVIFEMYGKRYLRDLGSRTGTHINGTAVHQEPLEFGDVICIGDTEMTYVAAADVGEPEDLAGTAPLASDEPLDLIFEEPAPPSRPAARAPQGKSPPPKPQKDQRPAARHIEPAAAPAPAIEHGPAVPPLADRGGESAAPAPASQEPAAAPAAAAASEPDLGLEFNDEGLAPVQAPEAMADDLGLADVPAVAEAPMTEPEPAERREAAVVPEAWAGEPAGKQKKGPIWGRLFGRAAEAEVEKTPAAAAPAAPVAEAGRSAAAEPAAEELPLVDLDALSLAAEAGAVAPAEPDAPLALADDELLAPASAVGAASPVPPREIEEPLDLDLPATAASPAPGEAEAPLDFDALLGPDIDKPTEADRDDVAEPVELTPDATPAADATTTVRAAADAMELELADLDDVEVVDKTEPTPESAQDLELVLADEGIGLDDAAQGLPEVVGPEALSDSVFGREVEAFHGSSLGPIVEAGSPAAEAPAPAAPFDAAESAPDHAPADEPAVDEAAATPATAEIEPAGAGEPLDDRADLDFAPAGAGSEKPVAEAPSHDALDDLLAAPVGDLRDDAESVGVAGPVVEREAEDAERETATVAPHAEAAPDVAEAAPIARSPGVIDEVPVTPEAAQVAEAAPEPEPEPETSAVEAYVPLAGEESGVGGVEAEVGAQAPDVGPAAGAPAASMDAASGDAGAPAADAPSGEPDFLAEAEPAPSRATPAAEVSGIEGLEFEPLEGEADVVGAETGVAEPPVEAAAPQGGVEDEVIEAEFVEGQLVPEPDAGVVEETPDAPAVAGDDALAASDASSLELGDEDEAPAPVGEAQPDEVAELEPDPLGLGAGPTADAPAAAEAPPHEEAGAGEAERPAAAADMFFGLERDTASFLGGMPLRLPPLQGPFARGPSGDVERTQGRPAPAARHEVPPEGDEPEPDEPELLDLGADDLDELAPAEPGAPSPGRPGGGSHRPVRGAGTPASPFDLNLEDAPTHDIEIPPFSGSPAGPPPAAAGGRPPAAPATPAVGVPAPGTPAAVGHVTTAFDGLVMMPLRETDVFSQTPVSALSIPPFGGPPGPAAAAPAQRVEAAEEVEVEFNEPRVNDLDPDDPEGLAAQDLPFDDDDGTPAPGAARPGDGRRAVRGGGGGSRRPPAYPAADPGAAPKRKRRWRIGKWGLLGVMIVCMVAVTLAMWVGWPMVFPNAATVTAAIKFDDRLASLPEGKRNQLLADQRQKLLSGEVRASAREILDRRYNVPAGFLAEAGTSQPELVDAARRYNAMVNGARLVEKKPVIELEHGTADAAGDRLRVRALLEALYSANKTMRDAAAQARVEYATAVRELERAKNRQDDLRAEMESARKELGERDVLGEKRNEVEALQEKDKELTDALVQASARVRALRADLLAAETSTPLDPDADPERLPALPQDDEQVVDMSRRVEELTASLAEKKRERAAKAEEANKALQAALGQFQQDIEQARGAMEPDSESELGRYLATAEKVQSRLRQLSLDLQQQQQTDMQRMTRLKEKLADKNAARIREAFAADGELQRLQEELALRERQHTTALGNGLRQDAAAITKQIQRLKREIGERQDLLTTAGGIGPDRETQEFLDETLARMAADRERNGRIMSEMLEELAGQAPAAGSLPAEQKKFAESLEQRQAALNDARERYNAAMSAASADADAELRRAEDELASVQAKIDERKKQVAEASRESMTQEQQRARLAATTRQQRQLDRAEEAERAAEAAYKDNVTALRAASNELEQLTARSGRFERESQRAVAVQQEISALGKRVAALQEAQETNVEPVPPEPDHVAVAAGPDHRREYILGANLALLFGFLVLVMLAPADPSAVGDEDGGDEVPFASASYDGARNGDGNGDGFDGDGNGDGARPSRQRDDETVSA